MHPNPSSAAVIDQAVFAGLQPAAVWQHFATLCRIPRASKQEAALRDTLKAWAEQRGLNVTVDAAGNLIIRKPASADGAHLPTVILQGHLDMVCQSNADAGHDWSRDPVVPVLRDGWLVAEKTTLGADNGIGVALILAVLEDEALTHGPIEALLTVDEEAGMGGARGLEPGLLKGRLMLNLDTEAWGEFYLGCAGGLDVNVERPGTGVPLPADHAVLEIRLSGLRGGHSGVDIHEDRGNAIKLLVRVLCDLRRQFDLQLIELTGGTARNALPREARALLALPAAGQAALANAITQWQQRLQDDFTGIENGIQLSCSPATAETMMAPADQSLWLNTLNAAPHGVYRMSQRVPGVVETSNNLGMLRLSPGHGSCNFMVRSLVESGAEALAAEIASLFALTATSVHMDGHYPGWAPNPASPLLALCQAVYQREFGGESAVKVIHAGLECGLIGAKYPGLDIVSFGPTIHGAHAPGEAVEIASVDKVWQLLRAILSNLAPLEAK
jgi:dipeptidase D